MRIALYQPDIPQNTGTILRLAACLGVSVDIIEPAGFQLGDTRFRRALMDYTDHLDLTRHDSWEQFLETTGNRRLVLLTTKGATSLYSSSLLSDDVFLFGRESAGVPDLVHARADLRVTIPMAPGLRSINVAMATAMTMSEALRQSGAFSEIAATPETDFL
ncbi:MAG: tRNA methyltransferase [Rhodospirillaceae bacterium]|nr:tRNA methyltransferase [Rhodospirillaceae bacterium]|tara:strand:+ start:2278 stop:2760 length:483 start_codon:yes stop_codon:yes gene_type:complete